mmetsp:Transcript_72435/g.170369  ORF Transcript_72435/g.170369 Transcript_72435/m.170369 type:complete len:365 (+) Transcript_72435:703-1797(+)
MFELFRRDGPMSDETTDLLAFLLADAILLDETAIDLVGGVLESAFWVVCIVGPGLGDVEVQVETKQVACRRTAMSIVHGEECHLPKLTQTCATRNEHLAREVGKDGDTIFHVRARPLFQGSANAESKAEVASASALRSVEERRMNLHLGVHLWHGDDREELRVGDGVVLLNLGVNLRCATIQLLGLVLALRGARRRLVVFDDLDCVIISSKDVAVSVAYVLHLFLLLTVVVAIIRPFLQRERVARAERRHFVEPRGRRWSLVAQRRGEVLWLHGLCALGGDPLVLHDLHQRRTLPGVLGQHLGDEVAYLRVEFAVADHRGLGEDELRLHDGLAEFGPSGGHPRRTADNEHEQSCTQRPHVHDGV